MIKKTKPWIGKAIKFVVGTERELELLKAQNGRDIVEVKTYLDLESGQFLVVPIGLSDDDIRYNYSIQVD